jgi:hypothetical protein
MGELSRLQKPRIAAEVAAARQAAMLESWDESNSEEGIGFVSYDDPPMTEARSNKAPSQAPRASQVRPS